MKHIRLFFFALGLMVLVLSCEESNLAVTPTADLSFTILDNASGDPIPDARVYLFDNRTTYENYLSENPDADPAEAPNLNPENIGVADANGVVTFLSYDLDGPNFASGNTFFYKTDPIYLRAEGSLDGSTYLTNDGGENRLDFGEVESGGSLVSDVEVFLQ